MIQWFSSRSLPLLLVFAASCWIPRSSEAADPARPHRGSAVGVVVEQEALSPTEVFFHIEYEGIATHFGRFTRTEFAVLNPMTGYAEGLMIYTAANGDELRHTFEGQFLSETTIVGTYTFTGGTGRFEGATGEADFVAVTPDFINVEATFEGTLRY